ncbi:hypothetical protein IJI72_02245 [Candidatus Saccharibacteria bacterium]|nr:hypothetical protein [Candidatus Saccharibacteria bacterium]
MLDQFFSPEALVSDLKTSSRALNLPEGSVEPIIKHTLEGVLTWLEGRDIITKSDLERAVSRELEKYSPDLHLLYENRNKFI